MSNCFYCGNSFLLINFITTGYIGRKYSTAVFANNDQIDTCHCKSGLKIYLFIQTNYNKQIFIVIFLLQWGLLQRRGPKSPEEIGLLKPPQQPSTEE